MASLRSLIAKLDVAPQGSATTGNIWVVHLRNADATKLATVLRAAFSAGSGGAGGGGGSTGSSTPTPTGGVNPAGTAGTGNASSAAAAPITPAAGPSTGGFIQADPSTNSLIITAPEPLYRQVRSMIDQLDERRAQVYIESLIVEVTGDNAADFGFQWQGLIANSSQTNALVGGTNFGTTGNLLALTASQLGVDMNDRWQSAQAMQDALRHARQGGGARHELPDDNDSLTFPITSKSPGTVQLKAPISRPNLPVSAPSSSARTMQMDHPPAAHLDPQMAFGETTLALDPMSKLPVSPIPSTERMDPNRMSPGALPNAPNAFPMQAALKATVPAFTPSSVRAVPPMPGSVPGYMQPSVPLSRDAPPPPPVHAAPTLRSSARHIVIAVIVFALSVLVGGWFAWYYLLAH